MYKISCKALTICFLVLSITACRVSNDSNLLPKDINGKLFIRGYMLSGSHELFWVLDLGTKQYRAVTNKLLIDQLNLKYLQELKYNLDEQKVIRIYARKKLRVFNFDSGLFDFDNVNLTSILSINPKLNYQEDNILSPDNKYRIISNRKLNKITIQNEVDKSIRTIKFNNYFFGLTFSPYNNYFIVFEKEPLIFSDGSNYLLKFVNLKTGHVYYLNDVYVSLPGSIIWKK